VFSKFPETRKLKRQSHDSRSKETLNDALGREIRRNARVECVAQAQLVGQNRREVENIAGRRDGDVVGEFVGDFHHNLDGKQCEQFVDEAINKFLRRRNRPKGKNFSARLSDRSSYGWRNGPSF
jgi:hypothetical protein